jgi:hypothetical protein
MRKLKHRAQPAEKSRKMSAKHSKELKKEDMGAGITQNLCREHWLLTGHRECQGIP